MPPELREERFLEHQWARGAFCQLFREPKALGDLSLHYRATYACVLEKLKACEGLYFLAFPKIFASGLHN